MRIYEAEDYQGMSRVAASILCAQAVLSPQRAREEVRELLTALLDHVNGEEGFGGTVRFHSVYQRLSALPCVAAVDALHLSCGGAEGASQAGVDVRLDGESLCYPGDLRLDFHDYVEPGRG